MSFARGAREVVDPFASAGRLSSRSPYASCSR